MVTERGPLKEVGKSAMRNLTKHFPPPNKLQIPGTVRVILPCPSQVYWARTTDSVFRPEIRNHIGSR